jgi:hypothetical protein
VSPTPPSLPVPSSETLPPSSASGVAPPAGNQYPDCQACEATRLRVELETERAARFALQERILEMEDEQRDRTLPTLAEHGARLDAHDRRFLRLEDQVQRLIRSGTTQELLLGGVDRKLTAIVQALGVGEAVAKADAEALAVFPRPSGGGRR